MRLVNTRSGHLEAFVEPPDHYAILSHRWTDEEVSFEEYELALHPPKYLLEREAAQVAIVKRRTGYTKIQDCCRVAAKHGFDWVWIDTCCIDKRSSAELSEAINSMWKWYEESNMCYVYLADVSPPARGRALDYMGLERSSWFTRAWTLQELLAPKKHRFYASNWQHLFALTRNMAFGGETSRHTFAANERSAEQMAAITSIPASVFLGNQPDKRYSAAQRMSWAARRQATRIEDVAYSLLGLFQINLPLLYGEGDRAFRRLQEEIIRQSDDETIFAWASSVPSPMEPRGLLAKSPLSFYDSADTEMYKACQIRPAYTATNKGLAIRGPCRRLTREAQKPEDARLNPRLRGLLGGPFYHLELNCLTPFADSDGRTDSRIGALLLYQKFGNETWGVLGLREWIQDLPEARDVEVRDFYVAL